MKNDPASFRDSCGRVYADGDAIYRTVTTAYAEEWQRLGERGVLSALVGRGLLPFEDLAEIPAEFGANTIALLRVPKLPFISYPYEWSFSQLKDAALLTLDLHEAALKEGFILKDASAYNVQFHKGRPVFIDHLSLETWRENQPWQAYGQFCQHFLAPLALMARKDTRLGKLSQCFIDGIPLDLASSLLPARTKLSPGLSMHLHLHAAMRKKHGDARRSGDKARAAQMSLQRMLDIAHSLRDTVTGLKLPASATEWGEYYSDTNYTPEARRHKESLVKELAAQKSGHLAVDLGANTGEFSRLLEPYFDLVLAPDGDHSAVDRHWTQARTEKVLPLLIDLSAPSPAVGWANAERPSFTERCRADFVMALAVIHHLRLTFGIPFREQAAWFASLLAPRGRICVEFVPREDSQVQRLLAARDDIFDDYSEADFLNAFERSGLRLAGRHPLRESRRSILVFER